MPNGGRSERTGSIPPATARRVSMTDTIDPARRSRNMSRIRGRDTKPEMTVRRLLHRMGYRYRVHRTDLPGKPDIVFGPRDVTP